jgi:LysM repeat protein
MQRYERRRFFVSLVVWSIVLVGGSGTLAVKFGWLPFEFGEPGGGSVAGTSTAPGDRTGPPPAAPPDAPSASSLPRNGDPVVFHGQSEPGHGAKRSDADPDYQRVAEPRRLLAEQFGDRARPLDPPSRPPEFVTAAAAAGKRRSSGPNYADVPVENPPGRIVRVGAEEPTTATGTTGSGAPPSRPAATADSGAVPELAAIDESMTASDYAAAHRELSKLWWNRPELRETLRDRIETTANSIFFAPRPHYMEPYEIQPGDRLSEIGKKYQVPWQYLVRLNQVDPRRIRPGQLLKVVKGPMHALVDLSDFELTVHAHGYYVRRYRVGIGRDGRSPVGKFAVLNKVVDPQYTSPEGKVIAGDDPQNPLGERWLDLGDGYGIHGTIDPDSIGKAESRGCIRLTNEDVAEVYDLLGVGSEVVIRP